jgi:hypothetical protein
MKKINKYLLILNFVILGCSLFSQNQYEIYHNGEKYFAIQFQGFYNSDTISIYLNEICIMDKQIFTSYYANEGKLNKFNILFQYNDEILLMDLIKSKCKYKLDSLNYINDPKLEFTTFYVFDKNRLKIEIKINQKKFTHFVNLNCGLNYYFLKYNSDNIEIWQDDINISSK